MALIRFYKILSAFAAAGFLAMYFSLAYYNRIVFDDFSVISTAIKYGSLQGALVWYKTLDGCIITVLIHQYAIPFVFFLEKVFVFNYFTILLLVGSVFLFINQWAARFRIPLQVSTQLLSALIFVTLFYFTCPHITQCFYWLSSIIPYLYPIIFLMLAFALFANADSKVYFFLSCLFFFFFGLTRIHVVFPVFAAIAVYPAAYFLLARKVNKRWIIVVAVILAGMVISVGAPGNYKRQALEASLNLSDPSFSYSIVSALRQVGQKILYTNLRFFIVALPLFLFAGVYLRNIKTGFDEKIQAALQFGVVKLALLALVITGGLFFLNSLIMYVAVKNCYYVDRVWAHFFLTVLLMEFIIGFLVGYKYARFGKGFFWASCLAIAYLSYASIKSAMVVLPFEREYAKAYDRNIQLVKEAKAANRTETLYFHAMPANSGYIQHWMVKADTSFWVNVCLAYDYGLACSVSDSTKTQK